MREIVELLDAFKDTRRREVQPAARLLDVERLLGTNLLPRIIAFSGHEFCGHLLFESESPHAVGLPIPMQVPSADSFIRLFAPGNAPELQGIFLNACKSER